MLAESVLAKSLVRRSPVPAFPPVYLAEELFHGLAMSQFGEFETDLSATRCQMAGSFRGQFGDDAQRGSDSVDGSGEVPERDPALGRSQQSLC